MCLFRDARGFLWICTPAGSNVTGLTRFDGQRFTTCGPADGIPNTTINGLATSLEGTYWLATNGRGVVRVDASITQPVQPKSGTAKGANLPSNDQTEQTVAGVKVFRVGDSGASNRVNVVFVDRSGAVWAGTDDGLFYFESRSGSFRSVSLPVAAGNHDLQVWAVAGDLLGRLWIGTSFGLLQRSPDGHMVEVLLQSRRGTFVRAITVDGHTLWIGCGLGLLADDLRSVSDSNAPVDPRPVNVNDPNEARTAQAIVKTAEGILWVGGAASSGLDRTWGLPKDGSTI